MKEVFDSGWWGAVLCLGFFLHPGMAIASEHLGHLAIPESILIQVLQNEYGAVDFNHKIHVEKSKGCPECHHHTSAMETRKCAECHDLKKMALKESLVESFLSCKSCHRKYSKDNPSMPGLLTAFHLQCLSCHKMEGPEACKKMCHTKPVIHKGG
ncbi:MAG: cytochrome c family protein [Nitrospinota bacterium]|nr:cytochrome c family protein [Nitrospinota bacterium]